MRLDGLPRWALALAVLAQAAEARLGLTPAPAPQPLVFFALADWGGQSAAPYTTPGQLAAAASLGRLADELKPRLVLSAGGNFLPQGLPGAARPRVSIMPPGGRLAPWADQRACCSARRRPRAVGCARQRRRLGAHCAVGRLTRHTAARSWSAVAEQPDALRGHL
jgi:hypothetical protein